MVVCEYYNLMARIKNRSEFDKFVEWFRTQETHCTVTFNSYEYYEANSPSEFIHFEFDRDFDCLGLTCEEDFNTFRDWSRVYFRDGVIKIVDGLITEEELNEGKEINKMTNKLNSEIKVKTYTQLDGDNDHCFLRMEITEEIQDLLKIFAVTSGTVSYRFGDRYKIKNTLVNSNQWSSNLEVFFDKGLIDTRVVEIKFENSSDREDVSRAISKCKSLIEMIFDILKETDVVYKIKVQEE